ncbi:uncharacterized protein LOC116258353 [Nymphaea colorata]|nr:uncharacterized protein LOC116258353 [Nymphaea colorata]XP_031491325.1 uncharacterized protein LOC116258353 [Nymphaea colorata]
MVIRIPSLVDLCVQTAIDNIKYIGDVGETDINLLKFILPHCTADQLMHIEASSYGRDLTAVTDNLWKKHYEQLFGVENANVVIKRMKKVQRSYKWRDLYKAKLKERDEAQKKSVDRLKNLYAQEVLRKQSRQIRLCSKIPPSVNKRSYFEGSGSCSSFSNVKGNLMKKAKMEYLNSHEAKVHAAMRKNALQKKSNLQSSASQMARPSSFTLKGSSSSSNLRTAVPSVKKHPW